MVLLINEVQARIAELEAEVARLRGALRNRTIEADDADHRAHTAWNDAIEAAAVAIESCAFDANECYASEETVNAIDGMASLCRALRR